ncbi:MAG: glycosyltransferase family 2 protein [Woeseiaceae bacterium]|nr:glycosyltransferase family 2 protein [Woeseiaceae bacterium]
MTATETNAGTVPRLSIVIATWQAAATLDSALRSVVEQEFRDWELLIPDGGSTDGTVDVIRQYEPHVQWWQSRPDEGIYDAWNQALGHARGEYVCFLGADDVLADERALARLFVAIGDDDYDLVTSCGRNVDASTGRSVVYGSAWDYDRIGRRMIVCHPGLLHRRTLFERFGRFDTRYRIVGDLDFLLRLPPEIRTRHVDAITVVIDAGGLSRTDVMLRLREQRSALARCERYGPLRAWLAWLDKLWRLPIARALKIPH